MTEASESPPTGPLATGPLPDIGLDYLALRTEGVRLVQALSGKVWTDYNFSDPGVTTLEQLCFALTELSYRALYPVADLLADPRSGRVSLWRQALYPAYAIMPGNPVTPDDLRRLLLDRVPDLANIWFTPLAPADAGGVSGLYAIQLHLKGGERGGETRRETVRRVLDRYAAHRALCEDVGSIQVLSMVPTAVAARVLIAEDADPDIVEAELLFALGLALAPEPKRQPLDLYKAGGKRTSDVFDGPLMLRGLIADDQLRPLPGAVAVSNLLRIMAGLPGVVLVQDLKVRVAGDSRTYGEGDVIPVPAGSLLGLRTEAVDGRFPIRLYQNSRPCRLDAGRVRRALHRLWREQRRTYDLWPAYRGDYGPPPARRRDLTAYGSVQDQFPDVYGINAQGLPTSSPARKAQARQLKGYLMPFDQLMADYFAQLALARELFSPTAGGDRTYAWQSLRSIVPDVEPLLRPDYEAGLAAITADAGSRAERQAAFLGLLLSLYAETVETSSTAGPPAASASNEAGAAALVRARRALLLRTVRGTGDRGRAFDYRHPGRHGGTAGMQIRCQIELDLLDAATLAGADPDGTGAPATEEEVDDSSLPDFGRRMPPERRAEADSGFMTMDRLLEDPGLAREAGRNPLEGPLEGRRVHPSLRPALADASRYRIGFQADTVVVICLDMDGHWWIVGEHESVTVALTVTQSLLHAAGRRHPRRRLTIVESTLLRYAMPLTGDAGATYGFRVTAVLHAARGEARGETSDAEWRRQAIAIIRRNTPAHIALTCLFLGHERMRRFATLHEEWVRALRHHDPVRRAETSYRLQRFLEHCAARTGADGGAAPAATPT